jgi:Fe-S-cluster-containing dehydrogenase component
MFVHEDLSTPIVCNLCGYSQDETKFPACVTWCPKTALKFEPVTAIGDSRRILQAKKMAKAVAEE